MEEKPDWLYDPDNEESLAKDHAIIDEVSDSAEIHGSNVIYMTNGRTGVNENGEKFRVTSEKQREAFREKLEREKEKERWRNAKEKFTFSDMREIERVGRILTTTQCGFLLILQAYMDFQGRLIRGIKKVMTTKDMMEVLSCKKSAFYNFLNACKDNGIIIEHDQYFSINPKYHFRGILGGRRAVIAYAERIKTVYSAVEPADLGLIYRMLPHVNVATNALCHNPEETVPSLIEPFTRDDLAEVLGMHPNKISSRLNNMTFNGEYVIARAKVGKNFTVYMLNPSVFTRLDKEPDATLLMFFKAKTKKQKTKSNLIWNNR